MTHTKYDKYEYETCGVVFKTKREAVRYARNIASALRLLGNSIDSSVMVYQKHIIGVFDGVNGEKV